MYDDDYSNPPISNPELNGQEWVFGSKLETYPNPNYLGIHTRAPLCSRKQYYSGTLDELDGFTILTTALIRALETIPGITEVSVRPYRVSLLRSPTYTWEEILKKALPVFVSYCPATY